MVEKKFNARRFETKVRETPITLPTQRTTPYDRLEQFSWLICGDRKIGKTELANNFNKALILFTEPGGNGLSTLSIQVRNWETIKSIVSKLKEKKDYCDTIVIDTGYMAYEYCLAYILDKYDISDPRGDWGSAWKLVEREFRTVQNEIIDAGFGLVVLAHTEVKTFTKRNGVEVSKLTTQLSNQATRYYHSNSDIILYYLFDEDGKREAVIRSDGFVDTGTRTGKHFLYTDNTPIIRFNMDYSRSANPGKEAYEQVKRAFENKLNKPIVKKTLIKK